jgi:peptidylprolyl isomerase/peptidyl-prolyl cis-trans isomerase B (cyclophilin B)
MKRLSTLLAISVLLLGAGCQSSQPQKTSDQYQSSQPTNSLSQTSDSLPTKSSMSEPISNYSFPGVLPESETDVKVRIKTSKGDIVIQLLPKEGPNAASNFVYLIKQKFYDGLTFHRYEPGFVIQGGDPVGNGTGGPGYRFADDKVNLSYERGIVAMANAGPNTNGSQFFIMLDNVPLPPSYSIFGRVIEGMNVVDQIRVGEVISSVAIESK